MSADEPTANPLKDKVLDAVLAQAPFDGWSRAAIDSAVRAGAITRDEAGLAFPGGVIDMIAWHSLRADRLLVEEMERLRRRLDEGARAGHPGCAHPAGAEHPAPRSDPPGAGDARHGRSTGCSPASCCTARSTPSGTPQATPRRISTSTPSARCWPVSTPRLCCSGSTTARRNFTATWAFLDRRIEDVMRIEKLKSRVRQFGTRTTSQARPVG